MLILKSKCPSFKITTLKRVYNNILKYFQNAWSLDKWLGAWEVAWIR